MTHKGWHGCWGGGSAVSSRGGFSGLPVEGGPPSRWHIGGSSGRHYGGSSGTAFGHQELTAGVGPVPGRPARSVGTTREPTEVGGSPDPFGLG